MQTGVVKDDNANILLNNMKWPIECLFVAIKPRSNTIEVPFPNNRTLQTWHSFSKVTETKETIDGISSSRIDVNAQTEISEYLAVTYVENTSAQEQCDLYAAVSTATAAGSALFALVMATSGVTGATGKDVYDAVQNLIPSVGEELTYHVHPVRDGASAEVDVYKRSPTIDRLSITAHGIDIYKEMPGTFFHSYTPYTYGGHNISAPEDPGAHMITFCLYPGSYQPSGHVNVSRAREFYLKYWSEGAVSSAEPADLIVVASAINFLLNQIKLLVFYSLTQAIKVHIKVCASVIWSLSLVRQQQPMCQIMQNRQIAGNSHLIHSF
jgi:hypothetical protein